MSQQFVDAYFNTRKRTAADDSRARTKVLVLDEDQTSNVAISHPVERYDAAKTLGSNLSNDSNPKLSPKIVYAVGKEAQQNPEANEQRGNTLRPNRVVRNIQFDSPKSSASSPKTTRANSKGRSTRGKKTVGQEGQADIRETFLKLNKDVGDSSGANKPKNVPFEKKGPLSPTKKGPTTPKKIGSGCVIQTVTNTRVDRDVAETLAAGSLTPKRSSVMDAFDRQDLSLAEIKNKITRSSRLAELKASMARINKCAAKLDEIESKKNVQKPGIKKFEKIELEVPVR